MANGPVPRGGGRWDPTVTLGQAAAPSAASGAGAVQAAESARQRRSARNEADLRAADEAVLAGVAGREDTRALGGRLFTLRDGVWTDVAPTTGQRVIRVRAFSSAYFEVLNALPELEPVLRELGEVVVAGTRVSVQVGGEGIEAISTSELRELVAGFRGVDAR